MYRSEQCTTERYTWDLGRGLPVIIQNNVGVTCLVGVESVLEEVGGTATYFRVAGLQ